MSVRSLKNSVPLLALRDATLALGPKLIFKEANIYISKNDKICLVGRNGSGKSTLLKALAGSLELDQGDRFVQPGILVRYLSQEPEFKNDETVRDYVKNGLKDKSADREAFRISAVLSELRLDENRNVATLSGGEARRAAIARVIISKPDILLLDEPTNHLDLHTIEWLENELKIFKGGFLLVSHDRAFLSTVSNKIWYLDEGKIEIFNGGFSQVEKYLELIDLEKSIKDTNEEDNTKAIPLNKQSNQPKNKEKKRIKEILLLIKEVESHIDDIDKKISSFDFIDKISNIMQLQCSLLA